MTHRTGFTLASFPSPIGTLVAGCTDRGACLLEFSDRGALSGELADLERLLGRSRVGHHRFLDQLNQEVADYFAGRRREFTVPVFFPGTQFQVRVWTQLQAIPYGCTISYEKLAHAIGAPGTQRAVGHANGANRLAIIVPCHRVVNKNGRLGGYGGGLWRKAALLELEGVPHASGGGQSHPTQRSLFDAAGAPRYGASPKRRDESIA